MRYPKYKYLYAYFDFLVAIFSIVETRIIVSFFRTTYFKHTFFSNFYLASLFIFIGVTFLLIFQSNNLYKQNILLTRSKHFIALTRAIFWAIILLMVISFIVKLPLFHDERLFVFVFSITSYFNFAVVRIIILRKLYIRLKGSSLLTRNVIIWGAGKSGQLLAVKLIMESPHNFNVVGFIDDYKNPGEKILNGLKVLGNQDYINDLDCKGKIDEIIIAVDNVDYERLIEISELCSKKEVNVKLTSELFQIVPQKIATETYSGIPVIEISQRIDRSINLVFKRIIDIIGAIIGLIILLPFFIALAVIIKLSSKGPVFYKQTRIGKNGKPFEFYKFRSMTVDDFEDKERQGQMIEFIKAKDSQKIGGTKIINISRVTGIGKFIRKTSIDELPQLINVLKGDMSLVGPRPCLPYEYENYDEWHKKRVAVTPGCTGVWQVSGRSDVSFNDSVVLDLYYINNMSPWLDFQLILKTVPVMVLGRGGR